MWLWKDYRKLKCLKIERVPGKKTIKQCNMTWYWPLLLPVNHKKLFLVPSSTLTAQLLLNGELNIKSAYLLFPIYLRADLEPASLCLLVPRATLSESLQASAALWAPPQWLPKAWRDMWPKAEPSIFGLSLQFFKKSSHSEFSANLYLSITSLCWKKSGASACASVHESPLWLDVHLLQGILELGVSCLDLVSLVQRERPCYQDPSMGCWGTLLGDKPAELQLQK